MDERPRYRPESIIHIEGNLGKAFQDIEARAIFKDEVPLIKQVEAKIDKWDCIKLISCILKGNDDQNTKILADWKKSFAQHSSNKRYTRYKRYTKH